MATTTPYLLIVGSDWVFSVDPNILLVVIARPPSRYLMTHIVESFLLVPSTFPGSDDRSSRIRVEAVVCEEWCGLDGLLISVVVRKFCQW